MKLEVTGFLIFFIALLGSYITMCLYISFWSAVILTVEKWKEDETYNEKENKAFGKIMINLYNHKFYNK